MSIELKQFLSDADYKEQKNVLVIGVMHGDEPQGEYLINTFLNEKRGMPQKNNTPIKNNVFYIPRLNSNNKRKNKNGIDLNRNFPAKNWELEDVNSDYFGGFAPNSEEETKFLVQLIEKINFNAIITIHAPYKIVNYDGAKNKATLPLAKKISEITGYPLQADIGYPTKGSFGTYAGVEKNIPTITIEVDETVPVQALYPNFKELFNYLELEF